MESLNRYLKFKRSGHIDYGEWGPKEKLRYLKFTPKDVKTILDVGCGRGELLYVLIKEGYEVEGCDIDPFCIQKAKDIVNKVNKVCRCTETLKVLFTQ